jgi:hypothetical protein
MPVAVPPPPPPPPAPLTLLEARKKFKTQLTWRELPRQAPTRPPAGSGYQLVQYTSPAGKLAAYLSQSPQAGQKHPAIIWITGGDCNSVDAIWEKAPANNDQTAQQYRRAGVIMMFPSLRGGNTNPGVREGFYGEVDDVIAAAEFLAQQPDVDANRIYLGGHSTGGTMVLLVAAASERFRATFSFGPVEDVARYGTQYCPFNLNDPKERHLRAPLQWVSMVRKPVFIFEGMSRGNLDSLQELERATKNPLVRCYSVGGHDHFTLLTPLNTMLARKVLADTGPTCAISVTTAEVQAAKDQAKNNVPF